MVKKKTEGEPEMAEQTERDPLLLDASVLVYLKLRPDTTVKDYEALPQAERNHWYNLVAATVQSFDRMNMALVPFKPGMEVESAAAQAERRMKNIDILTDIIQNFLKDIKTIKCPKCGSPTDLRARLFPCRELAYHIIDVKK